MATRLATYEELLALPGDTRAEVLGGQIVTQPSALFRHGRVASSLTGYIGRAHDYDNRGPDGWWIVADIDVRFTAHDIVRPDVVGWRRARLPSPWDQRPIDVVPDWICEILSPSNERHDRVYKQRLYARHGVPHYWIINPAEQTLEAYNLESGRWVVFGVFDETAVVRIAPFEATELAVGLLFPPPSQA
jgi:Uma2 family endonuclease